MHSSGAEFNGSETAVHSGEVLRHAKNQIRCILPDSIDATTCFSSEIQVSGALSYLDSGVSELSVLPTERRNYVAEPLRRLADNPKP